MKRFKLSRKEKLLYATPLLLPLLVLAWPLVRITSFDRTLQELAGTEAVDCGITSSRTILYDPCAIAAFKADKPFIVRENPITSFHMRSNALVKTPHGQVYWLSYSRQTWNSKASLGQMQAPAPKVVIQSEQQQIVLMSKKQWESNAPISIAETKVWW